MKFSTFAKIPQSCKEQKNVFGKKEVEQLKAYIDVFAENGHGLMVETLLENGASVDKAFEYALKSNHVDIANRIIELGYVPSDRVIKNCFNAALSTKETQVIELLNAHFENKLSSQASNAQAPLVSNENPVDRLTSLILGQGSEDEILFLLNKEGALLPKAETDSALYIAAKVGLAKVVDTLIKGGMVSNANPIMWDNDYFHKAEKKLCVSSYITPIQIALEGGHLDIAKLLIEQGAKVLFQEGEIGEGDRKIFINNLTIDGDPACVTLALKHGFITVEELPAEWQKALNSNLTDKELLQKFGSGKRLWLTEVGIEPPHKNLAHHSPYGFSPASYQEFHPITKIISAKEEGVNAENAAAAYAYKLSVLFGDIKTAGKFIDTFWNPQSKHPLHDLLLFELPKHGTWNIPEWRKLVLNPQNGLAFTKLLPFAALIEKQLGRAPKDYTEAKEAAAKVTYARASEDSDFAKICTDFAVPEEAFNAALNTSIKTSSNLPDVTIDGKDIGMPGYKLTRLKIGDKRGFLLGEYTNCCQSIHKQGAQCAVHLMSSPDADAYLITQERKNKPPRIIAQSFAGISEDGETIIMDSWERLGEATDALLDKFYPVLAYEFQKHGFKETTLGLFSNTPRHITEVEGYNRVDNPKVMRGYRGGYSDSEAQCTIPPRSAEVTKATPNDRLAEALYTMQRKRLEDDYKSIRTHFTETMGGSTTELIRQRFKEWSKANQKWMTSLASEPDLSLEEAEQLFSKEIIKHDLLNNDDHSITASLEEQIEQWKLSIKDKLGEKGEKDLAELVKISEKELPAVKQIVLNMANTFLSTLFTLEYEQWRDLINPLQETSKGYAGNALSDGSDTESKTNLNPAEDLSDSKAYPALSSSHEEPSDDERDINMNPSSTLSKTLDDTLMKSFKNAILEQNKVVFGVLVQKADMQELNAALEYANSIEKPLNQKIHMDFTQAITDQMKANTQQREINI